MTVKTIVVEGCNGCPYCEAVYSDTEFVCRAQDAYEEVPASFATGEGMPDWCPLDDSAAPDLLAACEAQELAAIERFVARVCERAEGNMLKTGHLEGAHYAAMTAILGELRAAIAKARGAQ